MKSEIQKSTDFADNQPTALEISNNQKVPTSVDGNCNMQGKARRTIPSLNNILIESSQKINQRQRCILSQILHSQNSKKITSQSSHQSFQNLNGEQEQSLPYFGGRLNSKDEEKISKIYRKSHKDYKAQCSQISQQIGFQNDIMSSQILNRITIKKFQSANQNPQNNAESLRKKIRALQSKVQILQQKVQILEQKVICLQEQKKQSSIYKDSTLKQLILENKQNSLIIQKYQRKVKQLQEQNSILKINDESNSDLDQSFPFMSQLNQKSFSLFVKKVDSKVNFNKSSPNISIQKQHPNPPRNRNKHKKQPNKHSQQLLRILQELCQVRSHLSPEEKSTLRRKIALTLI